MNRPHSQPMKELNLSSKQKHRLSFLSAMILKVRAMSPDNNYNWLGNLFSVRVDPFIVCAALDSSRAFVDPDALSFFVMRGETVLWHGNILGDRSPRVFEWKSGDWEDAFNHAAFRIINTEVKSSLDRIRLLSQTFLLSQQTKSENSMEMTAER